MFRKLLRFPKYRFICAKNANAPNVKRFQNEIKIHTKQIAQIN
jgi:hypothetical protein